MTARIPAAQGCSVSDRQPDLRIRLFGHVAVELDGAPFRLATPRKTLPILAYLLMNRDVPVARDFLAYVMWPDEEEESARSKLRMNLYELGRILPPSLAGSALLVTTDSVGVRPDLRLWLDVEEFDRLVGDPQRIEEAVALYRGDLLASLYDEWILPERERRRNLYLTALARFVSEARRQRDFHAGLERAQRILSLDPWREDIVRQVMALRSESGDRAGALAEYERFAQLLQTELGVDPMPETKTAREAIARGRSRRRELGRRDEPRDALTRRDAPVRWAALRARTPTRSLEPRRSGARRVGLYRGRSRCREISSRDRIRACRRRARRSRDDRRDGIAGSDSVRERRRCVALGVAAARFAESNDAARLRFGVTSRDSRAHSIAAEPAAHRCGERTHAIVRVGLSMPGRPLHVAAAAGRAGGSAVGTSGIDLTLAVPAAPHSRRPGHDRRHVSR